MGKVTIHYWDPKEPPLEFDSNGLVLHSKNPIDPMRIGMPRMTELNLPFSKVRSVELERLTPPEPPTPAEYEIREFVTGVHYDPVTSERTKTKLRVKTEQPTVAASGPEAASQARPAEGGQPKDKRTGRFRQED